MNPKLFLTIFSFRNELKYVLLAFLIALSIPIIAVILLTHDPATGEAMGIDIANPYGKIGDPITPFMQGKVIYAGEIFWGYGKHIIIDNGNNITSVSRRFGN